MVGADAPELMHQLSLSGTLPALIPEYRVSLISSLPRYSGYEFVARVKEFPIRLPAAKFGAAFIDVTDTDGHRAFSILFDRLLFQDDRDATLRLDKPTLGLSIRGGRALRIHHCAWIAEKVCYGDMPNWNEKEKRLACARRPIVVITRDNAPSRTLVTETMRAGGFCYGCGWFAFPELPRDIKNGETVIVTVSHDTGDLWGRLAITSKHTVDERNDQEDHTR
jgi:hypothetical protein